MTERAVTAELSALSRRRRRYSPNARRGLLLFTIPSVIWYLVFTVGPLVAMVVISFLNWRSIGSKPTAAGLDNYLRIVGSEEFRAAAVNTAIHLFASLPIMMVASFMIGYYLNLKPRGHRFLRVLMFAPALISISALGTMFVAVFGATGLVNGGLQSFGLGDWAQPWLAQPSTALLSVIIVTVWSGTGFNAVLFAARLAAVPEEIYDAASLDGANEWQKMWRIAFPVVIDYFGVLTMLGFLGALFGSAGIILLLTHGGPGFSTTTFSFMVYHNAFVTSRIGYSQSIGVLLFVLGVIGLLVIRRIFRQRY